MGCQKSYIEPSYREANQPKEVQVAPTNPNRKDENKQLKASEVYEIGSITRATGLVKLGRPVRTHAINIRSFCQVLAEARICRCGLTFDAARCHFWRA